MNENGVEMTLRDLHRLLSATPQRIPEGMIFCPVMHDGPVECYFEYLTQFGIRCHYLYNDRIVSTFLTEFDTPVWARLDKRLWDGEDMVTWHRPVESLEMSAHTRYFRASVNNNLYPSEEGWTELLINLDKSLHSAFPTPNQYAIEELEGTEARTYLISVKPARYSTNRALTRKVFRLCHALIGDYQRGRWEGPAVSVMLTGKF